MQIIRNSDKNQLIQSATTNINELLKDKRNKPVLLMLSGGSAFDLLNGINLDFITKHTTISMLDERYSTDPKINNFMQLMFTKKTFFDECAKRKCNFINTVPQNNPTIENLANRFQNALKQWRSEYPKGEVIATIGAGPDGHTAGIMPYPENEALFRELFLSDRWVVGYDAKDKNIYPKRITTTITYLTNMVDHTFAYICGNEKLSVLRRIFRGQGTLSATPARVMLDMKDFRLFTDVEF